MTNGERVKAWIDRRWQARGKEVLAACRQLGKDRALIAATPGAGKTKLAADEIRLALEEKRIDCAVIVVPSRALKLQWLKALREAGVRAVHDIDNSTLEERRARGMMLYDPERPVSLVTYPQVASFPELFSTLSARHAVYAVFDEIHHADDEAVFGQSLVTGFDDAIFKLSLSGTPFNTKGTKLAFCGVVTDVNKNGGPVHRTVTDLNYSYGEALQATGEDDDPHVVRPVYFGKWNGVAQWEYHNVRTGVAVTRTYDGSRRTDPLTPLIDATTDSMKKMLRAALDTLEEIREHHATAGMLITARDTTHCEDLRQLLTESVARGGLGIRHDDIVVVVYDTPGAHALITRFDQGRQRILIAVKMISEGVDIKRLRVGVYASNVLTRMFFIQFIGRFIRWDKTLDASQFACVLIPEHVVLIEYATEIERMIAEAAIPVGGTSTTPGPTELIVTDKSSDGQLNGAIQHGVSYAETEMAAVRRWAEAAGAWGKVAPAVLARLYHAQRPSGGDVANPVSPTDQSVETNWGKLCDKLVGRIIVMGRAQGVRLSYDHVNYWANRAVNIQRKDKLTPPSVLQARSEHLRQLLIRVIDGKIPNDLL